MPFKVSGRGCLMVADGTHVWLDVHVKVLAELLDKHLVLRDNVKFRTTYFSNAVESDGLLHLCHMHLDSLEVWMRRCVLWVSR
jgi:hypothetical protein